MSGVAPISGIHKANLNPFVRRALSAPKSVKIAGDASMIANNTLKTMSIGSNINLTV